MENKNFSIEECEDLVVSVPVKTILKICNPLEYVCWCDLDTPITPEEVFEYSNNNPGLTQHIQSEKFTRLDHIKKITYFLQNDALDPIEMDVGVPALGCYIEWMIMDGNHRFFAAILKNQTNVRVGISGCISYAKELGLLPSKF
jgi:hypothetical protein